MDKGCNSNHPSPQRKTIDTSVYRSENANGKIAYFRVRNGRAGRGFKQEVPT